MSERHYHLLIPRTMGLGGGGAANAQGLPAAIAPPPPAFQSEEIVIEDDGFLGFSPPAATAPATPAAAPVSAASAAPGGILPDFAVQPGQPSSLDSAADDVFDLVSTFVCPRPISNSIFFFVHILSSGIPAACLSRSSE